MSARPVHPAWRLAAIALALIGLVMVGRPAKDRGPEWWTSQASRPFEGQLSGRLPHLRYEAPKPGSGAGRSKGRVPGEKAVRSGQQATSIQRDLLQGAWDSAIWQMENQRRLQGESRALLNDLAVARMARSAQLGRSMDLLAALADLRRADDLPLGDEEPPAAQAIFFNRALCLEKLALFPDAVEAWRNYVELDTSGWAVEARNHLALLLEEPRSRHWPRLQARLKVGELDSADLQGAVDQFPMETRELVELEILGKPQAEPLLAVASDIARLLAARGDHLLSDGLAAYAANPVLAAAGHQVYAAAMKEYTDQHYRDAKPRFLEAQKRLADIGSSYAMQAELYAALCDLREEKSEQAREILTPLVERLRAYRHYPSLAGRALWGVSSLELRLGRFESASAYYREMEELIRLGDGPAQAAVVDTNWAALYHFRGQYALAWQHRILGLQNARNHTISRRRFSPLFEAADAARKTGEGDLAKLYLREALREEVVQESPINRAEAYSLRTRLWVDEGNLVQAEKDLEEAQEALRRSPEGGDKRRTIALVRLAEAEVAAGRDRAAAIELLEDALKRTEEEEWISEDLEMLNKLAKLLLEEKNTPLARKILRESVQTVDAMRNDTDNFQVKIDIHSQVRKTLDSLVGLEAADHREKVALSWSEASRHLFVPQLYRGELKNLEESLARVEKAIADLPPDLLAIEFHQLDDRLIGWSIFGGEIGQIELPYSATDLARDIEDFRDHLDRGKRKEIEERSAALYNKLLGPFQPLLDRAQRVAFVPDAALNNLPFVALFDAGSGHFLIENLEVTVLPTLLIAPRTSNWTVPRGNALVLGAPVLTGTAWADLPLLPDAVGEAREVAGIYGVEPLVLEAASRSAFLEGLPKHRIVHFGGHGRSVGPRLDDQKLLLKPDVAGGNAEVTARDFLQLKLEATDLVVLAACDTTGAFENTQTGHWGLAVSLLVAGAHNVVASQSKIEDDYSRQWMNKFHRKIADGKSPVEAAREVMVEEIRESGRDDFRWTGFTVYGQ